MARDDWRIRLDLHEEEHAQGLLERLGFGDDLTDEARELARDLETRRLAVSRDGNELFVYASTRDEAERARAVIEAELRSRGITATTSGVERWLPDEERWSDEPPAESWEEEELERGYAPWEVRIECRSHAEARELADRLEREGYGVERRFRYVIAGVASREEAEALAQRVHGDVEPGGELVWEAAPGNPFAVFGGIGGTGTPV